MEQSGVSRLSLLEDEIRRVEEEIDVVVKKLDPLEKIETLTDQQRNDLQYLRDEGFKLGFLNNSAIAHDPDGSESGFERRYRGASRRCVHSECHNYGSSIWDHDQGGKLAAGHS